VFALLKRFLEHEGLDVTLVENITDVNDKIYDAARAAGVPSHRLAREMTDAYRADTDRLELGRPDREPLASQTIDAIIDLIQSLIDQGHAYPADGDVYFAVRTFDEYGKLSNRRLEDLLPADQGEPDSEQARKRDPLDFALWKAQKPGEDTYWDSPWGRGRPGWHIECSAMAEEILGLEFDIHGGGSDLMFPHHENEIAQTEAGRGRPLARLWMHNGMIRFGEEKMAKSVGNVTTLADALDRFGRDALIVYMLGGHYRQPLAFSAERMEEARQAARRVADFARMVRRVPDLAGGAAGPEVTALRDEFLEALRADFNTPEALAALFKLVSEGNRRFAEGRSLPGAAEVLAEMLGMLALERMLSEGDEVDKDAQRLLQEREDARAARDFARADAARDELRERGWEVRDTPEGPVLVPASGT
jgi:cysteinyl-tRNA synthetase